MTQDVGLCTRWLLWAGVRLGALGRSGGRAGWWRDAPAVIGIILAAFAPGDTATAGRVGSDHLRRLGHVTAGPSPSPRRHAAQPPPPTENDHEGGLVEYTADRPTPLRQAADWWAKIIGVVGGRSPRWSPAACDHHPRGGITGGFLALNLFFGAVAGLFTAGAAIVSARQTVTTAEPLVTPLRAPQDNQGRRLVPESLSSRNVDTTGAVGDWT